MPCSFLESESLSSAIIYTVIISRMVRKVPIKNTSAVIVFILCFFLGLLFAFVLSFSFIMNIDTKVLLKNDPWLVVLFNGVYLIATGLLVIIFRNEVGTWSSQLRTWIGNTFPLWKKMSGLPEKKVQYYLSFEFNRRMALITALILISIGIILSAVSLSVSQ